MGGAPAHIHTGGPVKGTQSKTPLRLSLSISSHCGILDDKSKRRLEMKRWCGPPSSPAGAIFSSAHRGGSMLPELAVRSPALATIWRFSIAPMRREATATNDLSLPDDLRILTPSDRREQ
jgi:hypothetical protein